MSIDILKEILGQALEIKKDLDEYKDRIIAGEPILIFENLISKFNDLNIGENIQSIETWKTAHTPPKKAANTIALKTKYSELIGNIKGRLGEFSQNTRKIKVFISHGSSEVPLLRVERFLEALGVEPLIVKDQASEGKSINQAVKNYLSQADCAIILATQENEIDNQGHTGENIINEEGWAKKYVEDRIIYLLEDKVDVIPSNFREKVYQRFSETNLSDAFIKIAKELKAFGFI